MKPHGLISEAPPEKLTFERAVFSSAPTGVCMSDASRRFHSTLPAKSPIGNVKPVVPVKPEFTDSPWNVRCMLRRFGKT